GHLIASGEAGGNLAKMLDHAALAQEQEVETLLGVLTGMLEPLMILFMGGMVLTIVVAILLPIFNLNQLIQ
ncbi:MAG: type II secretion system F family protein, partial [Magnetococcales bacterium]|nr:type II secretion system F family protein [Magnetococcales bacterium]